MADVPRPKSALRWTASRRLAILIAGAMAAGGCTLQTEPGPVVSQSPSATTAQTSPAPTAGGLASGITQRIVFGDPWSKKASRKHAITESALQIINKTKRGERITLAIFNATYPGFADTLLRAHRRGVSVRAVINEGNKGSKQIRLIRSGLGSDQTRRSWAVIRTGGVRMHSKFLLSSRSDGKSKVVWVSSGNFSSAAGRDHVNDAFITTGDSELYDFFNTQFGLLSRGVKDPAQLGRTEITLTAIAHTFPLANPVESEDPVLAFLNDVTCVVGEKRTVIRTAQLYFTTPRSYLADRLRKLKTDGCDVGVLIHSKGWTKTLQQVLIEPGPGQIDLRSVQGRILHTKITTVQGWDAKGNPVQAALIGTHNWTGRALGRTEDGGVNDELALLVNNPDVVAKYRRWVDGLIKNRSVRVTSP